MSDPNVYSAPGASLYGGADVPPEDHGSAPSFIEQLVGLFTEPTALFKRLHFHPKWSMALVAGILVGIAAVTVWALKVDADAMLRPMLERNPALSSGAQIDNIIEMQRRFLLPVGLAAAVIGKPLMTLVFGLIAWGFGVMFAEGPKRPTFQQGFSFSAVAGLVATVQQLLCLLMALLRPVGGARLEQLSPASVGFYVQVESPKLMAALHMLDVFTIISFVIVYLGMRHQMKAKPMGGVIMLALMAGLMSLGLVFAR